MSDILITRLRYVRSEDIDKIILWVNSLPYKIEIKGNAFYDGKRWHLFYILPENDLLQEVVSGDLD